MGKTSKPTRILIPPSMWDWPKIVQLREQGHVIDCDPDLDGYDLILGENCWNMSPELEPYLLSHALPEARRRADERKKASEELEERARNLASLLPKLTGPMCSENGILGLWTGVEDDQ